MFPITPDADKLKETVEYEMQTALEKFGIELIKNKKGNLYSAREKEKEWKERANKLEDELRKLDGKEIRERFFTHDIRTDSSAYERALKPK